jgi:hypothetical protein
MAVVLPDNFAEADSPKKRKIPTHLSLYLCYEVVMCVAQIEPPDASRLLVEALAT